MTLIAPAQQWFPSQHARDRMEQMGVTWDEVSAVLADPDMSYPGSIEHRNADRRRTAVGGRLAVVYDGETVLTVLWRGAEGR